MMKFLIIIHFKLNFISGYVKAASIPSLVAGIAFGGVLTGGAYMTSQDPPQPMLQLGTSAGLAGIMGTRFIKTKKIMPAGMIAVLSLAMVVRGVVQYREHLPGMTPKKIK